MGDSMKSLDTLEEFQDALKDAGEETPVFIKFTARWCSPCKRIQTEYVEQANVYRKVAKFYTVDIDDNDDAAEEYDIVSVPNFMCFKNGVKVEKFKGADSGKLKEFIEKCIKG